MVIPRADFLRPFSKLKQELQPPLWLCRGITSALLILWLRRTLRFTEHDIQQIAKAFDIQPGDYSALSLRYCSDEVRSKFNNDFGLGGLMLKMAAEIRYESIKSAWSQVSAKT